MDKLKSYLVNIFGFIGALLMCLMLLGILLIGVGFVWNGVLTVWSWIL